MASETAPTIDTENLPSDIGHCHTMIAELAEELQRRERLTQKLEHQLAELLKRLYGPRRDKVDLDGGLFSEEELQGALVEAKEEIEASETGRTTEKKRTPHGRKPLPAHLPRERKEYDISEEEKTCEGCGSDRVKIREEMSEQLEYVPASMRVIEHVRMVYACPNECAGAMVAAEKPLQPIEKGLAGAGLLAHVATSKYCDHLPLYRQEDIFKRFGVSIPRSTQCDWLAGVAELVMPLVMLMRKRVLKSEKVHTDDTPVPVLEKGRGRTKTGRFWAYLGDEKHPYTVYDYTPTRSRDGPKSFLESYSGYLQADAYGGYDRIYATKKVTEVGCWAHARRKFVAAARSAPEDATMAIAWIRLLYGVEKRAKAWRDNLPRMSEKKKHARFHKKRMALRQEKAIPILDSFHVWLLKQSGRALPKSPLGDAVGYALNQWEALTRYAENGKLEIDNNSAEHAMRPVAIGRKNWLFAGSDRGGQTGAALYTLIASAKRHELDPFQYLRDVFSRIPSMKLSELHELLPDEWQFA